MTDLNQIEVKANHGAKMALAPKTAVERVAKKGKKAVNKKPGKASASKKKVIKSAASLDKKNKSGSKQGLLIETLQTKGGVTIDKIVKVTSWKPHSARAAISGLRKDGFKIEVDRSKDDTAVYRIVSGPRRKTK